MDICPYFSQTKTWTYLTNCVERKKYGELLPIPQEKLLGKNENGELLPIPREKLLGRKGKWRDSLHNEVKLLGLFAITVHSWDLHHLGILLDLDSISHVLLDHVDGLLRPPVIQVFFFLASFLINLLPLFYSLGSSLLMVGSYTSFSFLYLLSWIAFPLPF